MSSWSSSLSPTASGGRSPGPVVSLLPQARVCSKADESDRVAVSWENLQANIDWAKSEFFPIVFQRVWRSIYPWIERTFIPALFPSVRELPRLTAWPFSSCLPTPGFHD